MLLHEVLKYDTIEKVVGMELDQQVTRSSFKHFGTQPHWNNVKVEWWFGDAAKSLLALPEDYYGSFDMVLLDLSETEKALTVTSEISVMQALVLLLKPSGIMLKNEIMYFPEMSSIFPYSLHVLVEDIPIVCSQSFVLGSRNVDFLKGHKYNHDVDLLFKQLNGDTHYIIHDFQHNVSATNFCNMVALEGSTKQQHHPGIIMIVDAEEATTGISDHAQLEETVAEALSSVGMLVGKIEALATEDSSIASVFMFKEGYLVVHVCSEFQYCGFDIHLWSSFEKHNVIKKTLVETVGSKIGEKSSAYRIVAGGMFGTSYSQEQQKHPWPASLTPPCEDINKQKAFEDTSEADEEIRSYALSGLSRLIPKDNLVVVICGPSSEVCDAVKHFEAAGNEVVPLWSCPSILEDAGYEKDSSAQMLTCEKELIQILESHLSMLGKKKMDTVVLDSSTNYAMAQILSNMLKNNQDMWRWLEKRNITSFALLLGSGGDWRSAFVNGMRTSVSVHDPIFSAVVHFKRSTKVFGIAITSAGNKDFLPNLLDTIAMIEKTTGYTGSVESVRGGQPEFKEEFNPHQFFSHKHYNSNDAKKQWQTQKQLFFHAILQFEGDVRGCQDLSENIIEAMSELEEKIKTKFFTDSIEGDGCLILLSWSEGWMVLLWDGREHVDLNIHLFHEDWSFIEDLMEELEAVWELELMLLDVQPRGIGRVVNFAGEMKVNAPAWAKE